MKIFALDTSSAVLTLGLMEDEIVRGELMQNKALTHSEHLMPHIEYLLASLNEDVMTTDLFATTIGPGSFTGIRIGVATANAFAMASGKKVVGISTLEALAYNFSNSKAIIIATMYAQREDYYRGIYRFDEGRLEVLQTESAISRHAILEEASCFGDGETVIVGELADALREELRNEVGADTLVLGNTIRIADASDNYIRGGVLCQIAKIRREKALSSVSPVYIRKPQAEVQYEENLRKREASHE